MIRPPGLDGVAFTRSRDGDLREDPFARARVSRSLGLPERWAVVRQVHGDGVVRVDAPGDWGEADALWTDHPRLPLAVFTADCFGVALLAPRAVGVAHAGWRGASAGVAAALRAEMEGAGHPPLAAALGPGIGPCCFEVGAEVTSSFPETAATTRWGTRSVDLARHLTAQLHDLPVWAAARCTFHQPGWFSHRLTGTRRRMATIVWRG